MKPKSFVVAVVAALALASLGLVARRLDRPLSPFTLPVINSPELRQTATHPMQYYVSLPTGWTKTRTWPVVVVVPGSSKNWVQSSNAFAAVRDARRYPFIVVTPLWVTNGGRNLRANEHYVYPPAVWDLVDRGRCSFDMDGMRAVLEDVSKNFNGEPKAFLTGHSAGGHISVATALVHPELLRAAAFAATNYLGRCVDAPTVDKNPDYVDPSPMLPISSSPARVSLPVRFFLGTDDAYAKYLAPQRANAIRDATSHGFTDVSSVDVRHASHEPMVVPVLDFFASLLTPNER
jgi:poly(3-hydroxybutyrate) depolymerase